MVRGRNSYMSTSQTISYTYTHMYTHTQTYTKTTYIFTCTIPTYSLDFCRSMIHNQAIKQINEYSLRLKARDFGLG